MKKLKELLGKSFKLVMFIAFTILWSLFVYIIKGEWLYFLPLIIGDILFWETINWQFWKKREKKKRNIIKKEKLLLFKVVQQGDLLPWGWRDARHRSEGAHQVE